MVCLSPMFRWTVLEKWTTIFPITKIIVYRIVRLSISKYGPIGYFDTLCDFTEKVRTEHNIDSIVSKYALHRTKRKLNNTDFIF